MPRVHARAPRWMVHWRIRNRMTSPYMRWDPRLPQERRAFEVATPSRAVGRQVADLVGEEAGATPGRWWLAEDP